MTGLRPKQLAEAAGMNPQTVRYYERRGLIAEPARTLGGHRLYPERTVILLETLETGCEDLTTCATHPTCPLPFEADG